MDADQSSTVEGLRPAAPRSGRSLFHAATTVVLVAIAAVAAVDGLGWWNVVGVDAATERAEGDGYQLAVTYPSVTRPALASPFEIAVTLPPDHAGPVTLVVDRAYLTLWDENGLVPAPSGETSNGPWVEWEFDPPSGRTLTVWFDARIEPGAQSGRSGAVGVMVDDQIVVSVSFETTVRP